MYCTEMSFTLFRKDKDSFETLHTIETSGYLRCNSVTQFRP